MTDNNLIDLTNEDTISSLELIATTRNCNECKIRNCKWGTCNCSQITANVALDLITRQKAEIERLKFEIAKLLPEGCPYAIQVEVSNKLEAQIKSEAIKEFADRLKENITGCHTVSDGEYLGYDWTDITHCIDNLIKEMVVDANDIS